jgi:hypothetical protein
MHLVISLQIYHYCSTLEAEKLKIPSNNLVESYFRNISQALVRRQDLRNTKLGSGKQADVN